MLLLRLLPSMLLTAGIVCQGLADPAPRTSPHRILLPADRLPNHARPAAAEEPVLTPERVVVHAGILSNTTPLRDHTHFAVNAGPVASLFDASHRRTVFDAAIAAGFARARITGVLPPRASRSREDWSRLDPVFVDLLARNLGAVLVIEAGEDFRRDDLSRLGDLYDHLARRHGRDPVSTWLFEIIPAATDDEARLRDFSAAARLLRSRDDRIRVAGPGSPSRSLDPSTLSLFVADLKRGNIPLHFLSAGADMPVAGSPSSTPTAPGDDNRLARELVALRRAGGPATPTFFNDFSPAYPPPGAALNSTPFAATRLLTALHHALTPLTAMPMAHTPHLAYASLSDAPGGDLGVGLLDPTGAPKPMLTAFRFIHQLHDHGLFHGSHRAFVTRDRDLGKGVRLIAWHYSPAANPADENLLAADFLPAPTPDLGFEISQLTGDAQEIRVRRVRHPSGLAYDEPAQVVQRSPDGTLRFRLPLRQNDFCFVEIVPSRSGH